MAGVCAAALGPGYTIEKQVVEVSYTQQAPDRVSVRASYQAKNIGTKPLRALDIQPPDSEIIQPQELHVQFLRLNYFRIRRLNIQRTERLRPNIFRLVRRADRHAIRRLLGIAHFNDLFFDRVTGT